MAVVTVAAVMAVASAASAADKLVLQLNGPAQFEFAGYYAALWQGFYRDAGLDVEIKPGAGSGQPPVDPVRELTEGRAQFGTGTAELVVRIAQGLPLLLLAPIFQQSGAAVYYRADSDFASPGALLNAKLGRLPASNILDIELATALKAEGVDPDKLRSISLQRGQSVAALANHSVDAAVGSAWQDPWLAYEKGTTLKSFNPADYRVEFYGDTLFTLQRLAKTREQTVSRFRAASLKGWEYALQHPDEIAKRLVGTLPPPPGIADPAGFAHYQADLAHRLARYPEVELGHANAARWNTIEASMTGVGAVLRTADTADTGDYVFDPDAAMRNRTDRRALLILGTTLVAGLGVTALVWLRWLRRPVAAPAAMAAAGGAEPPALPAPGAVPAAGAPVAPTRREPVPAELNALLTVLERAMRQRVPRRVAFRLSLLPELWRCHAELPTVRGLVLDLVAAAVADLKGKGDLVVGTRNIVFDAASLGDTPGAQLGEYVRVTVRDNGPGLSEEALAGIFERARTARPAAAAAAEAMRALGGFARVESALGIGTAVHLYFPRVAERYRDTGAVTDGNPAEAVA
ncbi:MAG TPA: ABC transporter substrate-binding protein [Stellaceae bacterium]|nr:ABC transporter substrate-binding protein [Stellaceae bacterium]